MPETVDTIDLPQIGEPFVRPSLLPCPFCGGNAQLSLCTYEASCFISCPMCGILTRNQKTVRAAVSIWNARKS
jgi:Lar family restriction alleviation protein